MRTLVPLAIALVVAATGCSWIGVTPAKPVPGAHARYCTDSYFLPVVDSVLAAGWLTALTTGIVANAGHDDASGSPAFASTPLLLGAAAVATTYTASAVYGYRAVHACNVTP